VAPSGTTARRDTRSARPWLVGAVVAVVAIALSVSLAAWALLWPIHVTVDGNPRTVAPRATLLDLRERNLLRSERGSLLSVKGKVINADGGAAATVTLNGEPAAGSERLHDGDVVVSRNGADTTESRASSRESLPIEVVQEGTGPVVKLRRLGTPGVVIVTRGRISGVETSRSVVSTGDEMVVVRRPAAPGDKLVALTFDDGPWPGQTEKILAVLKKQSIHATFFMLGGRARQSPELARRVVAEGHVVGSHSLSHKELTKLGPAGIRKEISGGVSGVAAATGVRPVWFRPPYGAVNGAVRKQARVMKVKVALWDIDTLDWTRPGTHMLYRNAVRSTRPGQIVLMHDGGADRSQTIKALPIIIEDLRSKGFTFVTLDELAAAK
jgi:peptidoglycan-N-acetylglucosamine deacetylase